MRNLRGNRSLFQPLSTATVSVRPSMIACESSATIGLAVKCAGESRRYLGTDIDEDHVKVAQYRLAEDVG
jgi:hypothetical protein